MNSQKLFIRVRWNLLIAICIVIAISIFAAGAVYAAATPGSDEGPSDTFPQSPLHLADYGDLPNSYGITSYIDNGASHDGSRGVGNGTRKG